MILPMSMVNALTHISSSAKTENMLPHQPDGPPAAPLSDSRRRRRITLFEGSGGRVAFLGNSGKIDRHSGCCDLSLRNTSGTLGFRIGVVDASACAALRK